MSGALVIVGTPIGNLGDLAPRAVQALAGADVIACEDTRHTRKLLTHAGVHPRSLITVADHNEATQVGRVIDLLGQGKRVALVSDAGMPGVSDPGERLVRAAVSKGFPVEVVPGPSAAVTALVVSGFAADRFSFEGFLPRKGRDRTERLASIAVDSRTTVVFESPHRVAGTLDDLAEACGPDRAVAVARELTKLHEEVWRGRVADAAGHVRESGPRGEYVIVVAGAPPAAEATDGDVVDALRASIASGVAKKQAITDVARDLDVSRRRVYALALHHLE